MKLKLAAACLVLAACSSHSSGPPTESADTGLHQFSGAFCAKFQSCFQADFGTYFTSADQCASLLTTVFERYVSDPNAQVTTASVNQCTSEIQALSCPASETGLLVPADCPANGVAIFSGFAADAGSE